MISLNMCIGSLLIERVPIDFSLYPTLIERERKVNDVCHEVANHHFFKFFDIHGVSTGVVPVFFLHAVSKASNIILDDNFNENRLVDDLEKELKIIKAQKKEGYVLPVIGKPNDTV